VADFLVTQMQALGFTAQVDEAGNAVGLLDGPEMEDAYFREIVLLGHMDTVPGDIPVRIEDGRLYGRGSVDAKGPLATFVMAAAQAQLRPGTRLIVVGAVEEEAATSKGARYVAQQYQPDWCIIGEPSGWDGVTLGYKGRLLLDYELEQDMGHTAGPSTGVAEKAVAWWNAIDDYARQFNRGRPRRFVQLLPSLRQISTGSDGLTNHVIAKVGLRLPPDFDQEAFESQARAWAGEAQLCSHGYEPAFQSGRRTSLAQAFNRTLRQAGARPRFKLKTGTSDMNIVGPIWRCPIVAYGPGDSRLDHTPHEHLILDEYLKAIQVLQTVLAHEGKPDEPDRILNH
jgi:LysW-gamma-L-lysine carboxypeptidase